jgi:hypothetical protein
MAAIDERPMGASQICAQEGIDAIHNISTTIGFAPVAQPPAPQSVTCTQFADAFHQLAAAGVKLCYDEGSAWERFAATREMYEQPLHYVSKRTLTQDYLEFLPTVPQPTAAQ